MRCCSGLLTGIYGQAAVQEMPIRLLSGVGAVIFGHVLGTNAWGEPLG